MTGYTFSQVLSLHSKWERETGGKIDFNTWMRDAYSKEKFEDVIETEGSFLQSVAQMLKYLSKNNGELRHVSFSKDPVLDGFKVRITYYKK